VGVKSIEVKKLTMRVLFAVVVIHAQEGRIQTGTCEGEEIEVVFLCKRAQ